jgi:hypothetical protein
MVGATYNTPNPGRLSIFTLLFPDRPKARDEFLTVRGLGGFSPANPGREFGETRHFVHA